MWKIVLYAVLIITVNGYPVNDEDIDKSKGRTDENDLNLVAYIQSFKDVMLDYVKSQYPNLTVNEMESIKEALEDFLHAFAKDLKEVVEKTHDNTEIEDINDGIPDATFDDVKKNIKNQLPNMSDEDASLIVYKLRRNLMITRHKIDKIVKDSETAMIENDS
ncbi:uncharacterized protein LOC121736831 [Aricia agestis]|uniref:uncharacterized protein LOC121736831 n=1 Tax=Aricia agestis TaxID=91739 RepID=UPI001C2018A5|nr:uncharacterized protein LOC121736831 [Aricia agestis]